MAPVYFLNTPITCDGCPSISQILVITGLEKDIFHSSTEVITQRHQQFR